MTLQFNKEVRLWVKVDPFRLEIMTASCEGDPDEGDALDAIEEIDQFFGTLVSYRGYRRTLTGSRISHIVLQVRS
jgi:hypothetical protein